MCTCDEALELMSARMDGALTETETQDLNEHLASCDACRALARELQSLHTLLPQLEEEPPIGFREAVMSRIAAEQVILLPKNPKARAAWKAWVPMAAVFAVILVGAGVLNGLKSGSGNTSGAPMPMAASVEEAGGAGLPAPAPAAAPPLVGGAAVAGDSADGKGRSAYGLNGAEAQTGSGTETDAGAAPVPQPSLKSSGGVGEALTPREALDVLISYFYGGAGLPEGGELVDADGVLGYRLAAGEGADYQGLSANNQYFMFRLHTLLEGENGPVRQDAASVAVSLDGATVLEQNGTTPEDEAFRAATED